ncbi:MAG: hypothetical protein ACRDMX_08045 [Solirubrobacteraceae bacterium]
MSDRPQTIEDLERWRLFGAGWRILECSEDRAVYELCACTGETVERRESTDRELIAYLRAAEAPAED